VISSLICSVGILELESLFYSTFSWMIV